MNKKNPENYDKDELQDRVDALVIEGVRKPYAVMRLLPQINSWHTAERMVDVSLRRLRRRKGHLNQEEQIRNQANMYEHIIEEAWAFYRQQSQHPVNEKACMEALKVVNMTLKQKAELLGLEPPKEIKLKTQAQKNDADLYDKIKQLPDGEREQAIAILEKIIT